VRTTTEMNEWVAGQWAGVAQTFQVIRSVKRKRTKLIEQPEQEEQAPPTKQGKQGKQSEQGEQTKPVKQAKQAKAAKQRKQVEETSQQVVYGFSNLTPAQAGPEAIATFLRDHWAIENRLHWRRDVTLREDHSQVRTLGKPAVLAALNNVVLALMDWLGVGNVPDQMRLFNAFPKQALALLLGPLTFE